MASVSVGNTGHLAQFICDFDERQSIIQILILSKQGLISTNPLCNLTILLNLGKKGKREGVGCYSKRDAHLSTVSSKHVKILLSQPTFLLFLFYPNALLRQFTLFA